MNSQTLLDKAHYGFKTATIAEGMTGIASRKDEGEGYWTPNEFAKISKYHRSMLSDQIIYSNLEIGPSGLADRRKD